MRAASSPCLCAPLLFCAAAFTLASSSNAAPDSQTAAAVYGDEIRPLLLKHCLDCHSTEVQEAGLDIEAFTDLAEIRLDIEPWQGVAKMLESGEMPPEDSSTLRPEERRRLIDWTRRLLKREARLRAGDPGPAVIRRLNNTEYLNTIRDLTGQSLEPASQFPADNAAGEGFLNATDALAMSPALMSKYLDAANEIVSHVVLLPDGFRFSPSSFREDWVNEIIDQILAVYDTYATDLGEIPLDRYLAATIVHRDFLETGKTSFAEAAAAEQLSSKYLKYLWQTLTDDRRSPLLEPIRSAWVQSSPQNVDRLMAQIATWQSLVWRRQRPDGPHALEDRFVPLSVALATQHTYRYALPDGEPADSEPAADEPVVFYLASKDLTTMVRSVPTKSPDADGRQIVLKNARFELREQAAQPGSDEQPLLLRDALEEARQFNAAAPAPPDGVERLDAARFASVAGDASTEQIELTIGSSELLEVRLPKSAVAGRDFIVDAEPSSSVSPQALLRFEVRSTPNPVQIVRTLAWESQQAPPHLPVLAIRAEPSDRAALDASVEEFRRVFPISLCYPGIIVRDTVVTLERFHRGEKFLSQLMLDEEEQQRLNRLWSELHYVSRDALQMLESLTTLVQGEMKHYEGDRAEIERRAEETRQALLDSEPQHLQQLLDFATYAYRRPVGKAEQESLLNLYHSLRAQQLPHDEALCSTLARILVSANFLYRIEQGRPGAAPTPIDNWELASRLSYFLWSSMPDEELRILAAEGRLDEPAVLAQQARRMLADPRSRALAIEFATQWLEVRNFDQFAGKNLELFPEFDEPLRQAINEETILFFQDLFQADRPLWAIIDCNYAFLNERLAKHYGIPGVRGPEFRRVDDVKRYSRGGILGLASVLSKHSGASRTSPVLRGNWIAETVLGEQLPRPPDDVPELPAGDDGAELTVRELVEQHAEMPQCNVCHRRIDPLGFSLEQFDTIGRRRQVDSAGRPVDDRAELTDGTVIDGSEGLKEYLLKERRGDLVHQFCRKLLGFALGRRVLLSDRVLLQEMAVRLQHRDARVSGAVLDVVLSKQFQYVRGSNASPVARP